MRFVPTIGQLGHTGVTKVKKLRRKHQLFLNLIEGRQAKSWEINVLDDAKEGQRSLRELLMGVYSLLEKTQPLFISVDTAFNQQDLVLFTYLPRFETEVRGFLGIMVPYMLNRHGKEISSYFSVESVARAEEVEYNEITHELITKDDKYVNALDDDDDMSYFGVEFQDLAPVKATEANQQVERIYLGEETDSVGTLTSRKPPPMNTITEALKTIDDSQDVTMATYASDHQSGNFIPKGGGTIYSTMTDSDRITQLETTLDSLAKTMASINNKMTQVLDNASNKPETGTTTKDGTGATK